MDDTGGRALLREAWPEVAGRPGLTQGRYGAAGNLELVVPATDDGLWVGWFNHDPVESHAGAAVRHWSGALRFARGHRYRSADITQVDAGPDFLEVVARTTDGALRRHVWSPGPGFVDHGELAADVASCSAVVQSPADGSLQVAVAGRDGRVRLLRASPGPAYPTLAFEAADPGIEEAGAVDAAWHTDHLDLVTVGGDGRARLWCADAGGAEATPGPVRDVRLVTGPGGGRLLAALGPDGRATLRHLDEPGDPGVDLGEADDLVAAPVQVGGEAGCHVVTRRGRRLWHHRIPAAGTGAAGSGAASTGQADSHQADSRSVEARVWAAPGTATAHRG
jgi:hypothetical protein